MPDTTETTIQPIPLSKLVPFAGNVRKTRSKEFILELAASIKAHGLQQNLVVKREGKKFAVLAGGQRLAALQHLAKSGDVPPDFAVPCKIAEGGLDPVEISLLENAVRDDMHPADLFEAFRALVDKGASVDDIAARFGRSVESIRQLLKLGRVSPKLLKAYRADDLSLAQVKAFAVSDDHKAQEHVFKTMRPHTSNPQSIRAALTDGEIAGGDRRVTFVTVAEYENAGGKLRKDLFTEGADSVFIQDAGLLMSLAAAKLERSAKRVAKEGWKWTEFHAEFGYEQKSQFRRINAEPPPFTEELAAKVQLLEAELETLQDAWYATEEGNAEEETSDVPPRIAEIEQQLAAIEEERGEPVWTPEQLAIAGAVVTIGQDGKTEILRGLVRPEDVPKSSPKKTATDGSGKPQASALSATLAEDLTAQKSAALAAALAQQPDVALIAVVHALASGIFLNVPDTALQVSASKQSLQRAEGSKAVAQMDAARETWQRKLPDTPEELWTWCLGQEQAMPLRLLAFCVASTVDAVRRKSDRPDCPRLQFADMLGVAVGLDMKEWFAPDAKNYFSRVGKPQILDAIREGNGQPPAPAWEKLKKAELAALAEKELAGKAWLPALLRLAA
ncbi:MAG: ParB/RepB/Spo0J family partition protein [Bryobacteraceae bacterium]|nr:ParB/RepB/Spo0J family partition protein [Bryobacteraceae bacterium]